MYTKRRKDKKRNNIGIKKRIKEYKQQKRRKRRRNKRKKEKRRREERKFKEKSKEKKGKNTYFAKTRIYEAIVISLFMAVLYLSAMSRIREELTIEAGSSFPELSDFLIRDCKDAYFTKNWDEIIDMNTVADYKIGVTVSVNEYSSVLHVVDTVKPIVITKKVQMYKGNQVEAVDFIEKIDDATKTTVEFAETPNFTLLGTREVQIVVTDGGGNSVQTSAELEVLEDTVPPVIKGVKELTVKIGGSISYKKNVTVSDDCDENVKLTIDNSAVDLSKAGDYPLIYIATDAAGNVTKKRTIVHVKPPGVESATEDMVNAKADEILAKITTDDMSQYEVAKAIFNWVNGNVGWSDGTPKTDWVQGAYRGLFQRKGDCFVYASTSKCLLTRAGIDNMDIGFSTSRRTHYWNLINLGEGWYHFDTTRRTDGKTFFYCTDEQVMAYSNTHNGSHAYDASQYPKIQ